MEKKHAWYSSRFWMTLYAVVVLLLIALQLVLGLLAASKYEFSPTFIKLINGNLELPMEVAAWFWTTIIFICCGYDRYVDIKETQQLPAGELSMGDLKKLRFIIVESLFIFLTALVCSFIVDKDFQLTALFSAFGSATLIYIAGNKAIKANKYKHKKDKDGNGIPDIIQYDYEKWVRAQKKAGTDPRFITLEYFLDENPEIYARLNSSSSN